MFVRETFESLRGYCYENTKTIPLMFVLGFYVSLVVARWWGQDNRITIDTMMTTPCRWDQYNLLPWPDSFALMCVGMFRASRGDTRSRLMRRNMIRCHHITSRDIT